MRVLRIPGFAFICLGLVEIFWLLTGRATSPVWNSVLSIILFLGVGTVMLRALPALGGQEKQERTRAESR